MVQAHKEQLQTIGSSAKPLAEDSELYAFLTQQVGESSGSRRLLARLGQLKLQHAKGLNEDSRFLVDFVLRQLASLEQAKNFPKERRMKVEKEVNEDIRNLELFIQGDKMERKLSCFQKVCKQNQRRLGLSETVESFKNKILSLKTDLSDTFSGAEQLNGLLQTAKEKKDQVKSLLGFGSNERRLLLDSFSKVGELDKNIDKAYDVSKEMTEVFRKGKEYSEKVESVYQPLMSLAG